MDLILQLSNEKKREILKIKQDKLLTVRNIRGIIQKVIFVHRSLNISFSRTDWCMIVTERIVSRKFRFIYFFN